jgi:di/tripeptidase
MANRVTEEQKQAIRESSPADSARVVAERLGLRTGDVHYYRAKFKNEGKAAKPAKKAAKAVDRAPKPKLIAGGSDIRIAVSAQLDAWWAGLSFGEKLHILEANAE